MTESDPDRPARFSIRVAERVGPLLSCALRRCGLVAYEPTGRLTSVQVEADGDLVDVARLFASRGLEIDSIRIDSVRGVCGAAAESARAGDVV